MSDHARQESSHSRHRRCADELAKQQPARCAVLTISDTRTVDTDEGGPLVRSIIESAGHVITTHAIVRDEPVVIEQQLRHWAARTDVDVIITTGGTGFARRDGTIAVVQRLIDMPIDGFGELFRMISYERIGAAAMLSRAMGGLMLDDPGSPESSGTFLFALPGSTDAVRTAMECLIAPELAHLVMTRR